MVVLDGFTVKFFGEDSLTTMIPNLGERSTGYPLRATRGGEPIFASRIEETLYEVRLNPVRVVSGLGFLPL